MHSAMYAVRFTRQATGVEAWRAARRGAVCRHGEMPRPNIQKVGSGAAVARQCKGSGVRAYGKRQVGEEEVPEQAVAGARMKKVRVAAWRCVCGMAGNVYSRRNATEPSVAVRVA